MIRFANETDIPEILEIYGPYILNTAISFEYTVPTLEEFTQRFREITRQFPWLVWEENGKVLGYAYAALPFERAAFGWCAEPSIYLAPEIRGKGIGRKLYETLETYLWQQGYRVLYAIVTSDNLPSIAFHKALGYEHLADFPGCGVKFGRWHGVTWLQKRREFGEMPEKMPISFRQLGNSHEKP